MPQIERPNILVAVFDCLSEASLTALAGQLTVLPKLRQSSLCFINAYACSPQAGPARASLFTGLDMAAHGVWTDGVALPAKETTFAQHFAANGYATWHVGRRQLAGVSNWTTEHARAGEYAHFDWAHGPLHRSRQNAYLEWLVAKAPDAYDAIFPKQPDPDDTVIPDWQRAAMLALPDDLSFNTWVGTRTVDLISVVSKAAPFFGIAGFVIGETMGAQPDSAECHEAINLRALQQADAALGGILKGLKDYGFAKDTVVVVTSGRGDRSVGAPSQPMQTRALNVPLMINTPSQTAQIENALVSTMDIAPTLYEVAKLRPPQRVQGRSLLRTYARGWSLARLRDPDQKWQTALITDRLKLVMTHGDPDMGEPPTYQLYDLHADPEETTDLTATHDQDLEDMIDLIIDARVALEDRTEPRIATF